ncbi:MAG TPA: TlpA disulfide reductase family protein [Salinivirgaceae bacterium]|nr:TlpA disulfide reductase family protein [Salinivirgaceae bacterium]
MKRHIFFVIAAIGLSIVAFGQRLPNVELKTLQGKILSTSSIENNGKPILISFWATFCKPCIKELNALNDNYPDWKKETGVRIIAVSTDDSRSMARVAPFVASNGWTFDVYCDPNSDFKRAMNVVNIPHMFLIDGKGNIVWQHNSYVDGDEVVIYQKIKELIK